MMRLLSISMLFLVLSTPSFAADGILEINQTCAVQTGCLGSDAPGFPVTLGAPGSYVLTSDLEPPSRGTSAIFTATSDIVLDLNGFSIRYTVSGPGTAAAVLGSVRMTVRNGNVLNAGGNGIELGNGAEVVETRVQNSGGDGIVVGGESLVRDNRVGSSGGHGIRTLFAGQVVENSVIFSGQAVGGAGILVQDGSRVRGNIVRFSAGEGILSQIGGLSATGAYIEGNVVEGCSGRGIDAGDGATVSRNTVFRNSGGGISAGRSTIEGNTAVDNSNYGILGIRSTIVDNNATDSSAGINARNGSNVRRNRVSGNTSVGLFIETDSVYGDNVMKDNNVDLSAFSGVDVGGNICGGAPCP
jgi:parallel beta-helix repeat protein